MKVDRSILASNDQSMGMVADPDKLESSITHLANIIDSNDDQKLDKTGNLEGTWKGYTPLQVAEGINSQRLDTLEPKILNSIQGNGELIQINTTGTLTIPAGQAYGFTFTFPSAFSVAPKIKLQKTGADINNCFYLTEVTNAITTTSFTIDIKNTGASDGYVKYTWEAIGMG